MSSSSTSRDTLSEPVSRTNSRRAVSTTTAADAAAAPIKAVPAASASQRQSQPQPIPRFARYGARFKSKPEAGSGIAAPTRSPSGLSSRGFFKLGGGGRSTGARCGSSGSSEGATTVTGNGREAGRSRRHTHGHSHTRREREREREREPTKSTPPPPLPPQRVKPRSLPLAGPAALAATINSTLTVTTGRAAGETISTYDSSNTNGSGGGGGGGGGGGSAFGVGNGSGSGESGAEATSRAYSETWEWTNPDTPPPACMPNLHQSSGSEDPSGSEDDEGFGLGFHVDADYENFILQRRTASTSALKFRSAMMASVPGGGSLGVQTGSSFSSSSSSRPYAKGAEGFGPASAAATVGAAAPAAAAVEWTTTPAQDQLVPPRVPRSMSVGESGPGVVQPSAAPPPLPARRLVVGADAPAAAPARSPPRRRTVSVKGAKAAEAAAAKGGGQEDEEARQYFRDPRLETTLGLIRSGQAFCEERHIVVDFVRRAKPTTAGSGKAEVQPTDDLLRHALLLTNAALYLLEVEMLPLPLPPSQHQHQHQHQARSPAGQTAHHHPSMPPTTGLGDEAGQALATANVAAAAVGGSGCGSGSSSGYRSPRSTAGGAAGGAVVGAGTAGSGVVEKAKVKSIKLMDRLMPTELAGVSLPFREATLRNGDVVAKRGTGIVLHTRVEGRRGNLWLKCRSNQDRGALVDALVPWFETNLLGKRELDVQQEPEGPLATRLARFNASVAGDMARRKDSDCLIS